MLKPGVILLTTNKVAGCVQRHALFGLRNVVYSERADDGDHVVWYPAEEVVHRLGFLPLIRRSITANKGSRKLALPFLY